MIWHLFRKGVYRKAWCQILSLPIFWLWYKLLFKMFFSYYHEGRNEEIENKLHMVTNLTLSIATPPLIAVQQFLEKTVSQPKNSPQFWGRVYEWWYVPGGRGLPPPPLHGCLPPPPYLSGFPLLIAGIVEVIHIGIGISFFLLSSYLFGPNSLLPPSPDTAVILPSLLVFLLLCGLTILSSRGGGVGAKHRTAECTVVKKAKKRGVGI